MKLDKALQAVNAHLAPGTLRVSRLNAKERNEHRRLRRLWATGKASMSQMTRCMALDRRS